MLFKDAPDLIAEFKNFLPEAVNEPSWPQQQEMRQAPPPSPPPTKKPAPAKRKKRVADKEETPIPQSTKAPASRVRERKWFFQRKRLTFYCSKRRRSSTTTSLIPAHLPIRLTSRLAHHPHRIPTTPLPATIRIYPNTRPRSSTSRSKRMSPPPLLPQPTSSCSSTARRRHWKAKKFTKSF